MIPTDGKPRILCVDDEPAVLGVLRESLQDDFSVTTAATGAAALAHLEQADRDGPYAVIISDMRMPVMSGVEVLKGARARAPDTTRILLTGYTDIDGAIGAVNDGQIFRFLTKPSLPSTLLAAARDGVEQHRLVVSERVLLQETLRGAVSALTETLALVAPDAFGRGARIARLAVALALRVGVENEWEVETAAHLGQVGWVALPEETLKRLSTRAPLTAIDQVELDRLPLVAERLLQSIPRLEHLRQILRLQAEGVLDVEQLDETMLSAACLRIAVDYDTIESLGREREEVVELLRRRSGRYALVTFEALAGQLGLGAETPGVGESVTVWERIEIPIVRLRPGMIFDDNVWSAQDRLLIARGQEVTAALSERLRAFPDGMVREPVTVLVAKTSPADGSHGV